MTNAVCGLRVERSLPLPTYINIDVRYAICAQGHNLSLGKDLGAKRQFHTNQHLIVSMAFDQSPSVIKVRFLEDLWDVFDHALIESFHNKNFR